MITVANRATLRWKICQAAATLTLVLSTVFYMAAGTARADIVIDNFSDFNATPPFSYRLIEQTGVGSNMGTPPVETGLTGVIGGSRATTVFVNSGSVSIDVTIGAVPNALSYSSGRVTGGVSLLYNNNSAGLGASVAPFLGISLPILGLDLGNGTLTGKATLTDAANNTATGSVNITTTGTYIIPPGAFAGVDLNDLKSIQIEMDAGLDVEFILGEITILTPEPLAILGWSTVMLVGFCGWTWCGSRLRKA